MLTVNELGEIQASVFKEVKGMVTDILPLSNIASACGDGNIWFEIVLMLEETDFGKMVIMSPPEKFDSFSMKVENREELKEEMWKYARRIFSSGSVWTIGLENYSKNSNLPVIKE